MYEIQFKTGFWISVNTRDSQVESKTTLLKPNKMQENILQSKKIEYYFLPKLTVKVWVQNDYTMGQVGGRRTHGEV